MEPVEQNLFGIDPCVPLRYVGHCPLSELMFDIDGFSVLACASFLLDILVDQQLIRRVQPAAQW